MSKVPNAQIGPYDELATLPEVSSKCAQPHFYIVGQLPRRFLRFTTVPESRLSRSRVVFLM